MGFKQERGAPAWRRGEAWGPWEQGGLSQERDRGTYREDTVGVSPGTEPGCDMVIDGKSMLGR